MKKLILTLSMISTSALAQDMNSNANLRIAKQLGTQIIQLENQLDVISNLQMQINSLQIEIKKVKENSMVCEMPKKKDN